MASSHAYRANSRSDQAQKNVSSALANGEPPTHGASVTLKGAPS